VKSPASAFARFLIRDGGLNRVVLEDHDRLEQGLARRHVTPLMDVHQGGVLVWPALQLPTLPPPEPGGPRLSALSCPGTRTRTGIVLMKQADHLVDAGQRVAPSGHRRAEYDVVLRRIPR